MSRGGRRLERSASAAVLPVLALVPVWLLALAVFWLIARIWWKVGFVWFAAGYLALGVLLFFRPVQRFVLGPLLGARRPTPDETARLETAWRSVLQRNRMRNSRYMVMVLPSDELNAFACGGHLVVVTTFALQSLPRDELAGVLAHELSHHLGMHTLALTIGHWLSLPIRILARIGFFLRNVATAATRSFTRESSIPGVLGRLVSLILMAVSWVFLAGLLASTAIANRVGRHSEYQADSRAVNMGFGAELASALRRVAAVQDDHAVSSTSHPLARTRVARIDAAVRRRPKRPPPAPEPRWRQPTNLRRR